MQRNFSLSDSFKTFNLAPLHMHFSAFLLALCREKLLAATLIGVQWSQNKQAEERCLLVVLVCRCHFLATSNQCWVSISQPMCPCSPPAFTAMKFQGFVRNSRGQTCPSCYIKYCNKLRFSASRTHSSQEGFGRWDKLMLTQIKLRHEQSARWSMVQSSNLSCYPTQILFPGDLTRAVSSSHLTLFLPSSFPFHQKQQ